MVNNGAEEIYNKDGSLRFNNPQTEAFEFTQTLQVLSSRFYRVGMG
jgi:hypothetical protein